GPGRAHRSAAGAGTAGTGSAVRNRTRARAGRADEAQGHGRRVSLDRCRTLRSLPGRGDVDEVGPDCPGDHRVSAGDRSRRQRHLRQLAKLGLAEAQTRAGQFDQAIKSFQELAMRKAGPLPVDGILMQLARAYAEAGKRAEAQQTFNRVVSEFPTSPFSEDARKELESLKKS